MSDKRHDVLVTEETAEKRLSKVEAQTRALAEAVIAIVEPSDTVAPAIEAVKAGMGSTVQAAAESTATHVPRWNECPLCGSLRTDPVHRSHDGQGYKYFVCSQCKHEWAPKEN